jgi:hypothetical protein
MSGVVPLSSVVAWSNVVVRSSVVPLPSVVAWSSIVAWLHKKRGWRACEKVNAAVQFQACGSKRAGVRF